MIETQLVKFLFHASKRMVPLSCEKTSTPRYGKERIPLNLHSNTKDSRFRSNKIKYGYVGGKTNLSSDNAFYEHISQVCAKKLLITQFSILFSQTLYSNSKTLIETSTFKTTDENIIELSSQVCLRLAFFLSGVPVQERFSIEHYSFLYHDDRSY